ncbi:MAG: hypothetical protein R2752_03010 [Vicinamibacterales bacterium]
MTRLDTPRIRPSAVVLLIGIVSVAAWTCGVAEDDDWLACERLEFPCTVAEVPPAVLRDSLALGERAADQLRTGSLASAAAWLRAQAGVVEVLQSRTTVAFRLEGGRRIWLPADLYGRATAVGRAEPGRQPSTNDAAPAWRMALDAARRWLPAPVTLHAQDGEGPARRGGVVGVDGDGDGKLTQRDPREALILVPYPSTYLGEADELRALLETTPGYDFVDSVRVLAGPDASEAAFKTWNDYDLVHLATPTITACWSADEAWLPPTAAPESATAETCTLFLLTGTVVNPALVGDVEPAEAGGSPNSAAPTSYYQSGANDRGLEIFAVNDAAGTLEWRLFAGQRFFRDAYPSGVRRAVVFLNVSNELGLTGIGTVLAGAPARSTVVMWKSKRSVEEAGNVARRLYEMAADGWAPSDIIQSFLKSVPCSGPDGPLCSVSAKVDVDLRIREIVWLRRETEVDPPLVEDGQSLESLMDEPLAVEPAIDVVVDVHGIAPADQSIPVRLDLDGRTILERRLTEAKAVPGDDLTLRLALDDVPIDPRVQDGQVHELEAVVSLPRGGESRYSARLKTIDRTCYWEADVVGPLLNGSYKGAGVRLFRSNRISVLQLDSGSMTGDGPDSDVLTGVTLPLGVPPATGTFAAGESTPIGLFTANGIPASYGEQGVVDLETLRVDSSGQTAEVAGRFQGRFKGAYVNGKGVTSPILISGRFVGRMSGPNGCGSATFRWFDTIPRGGRGGGH